LDSILIYGVFASPENGAASDRRWGRRRCIGCENGLTPGWTYQGLCCEQSWTRASPLTARAS